ncbi:MAG: DinB family protein [Acidobacteria bacterium]|nr:DinB family protein [Acidobacteriota bacterium]
MKTINQNDFLNSMLALVKETFEGTETDHGTMYLDKETSLFSTLETVDAETASRSFTENGTTIAAHCEHLRFYIDFLNNYLNENFEIVNWKESWGTSSVTKMEWNTLRGKLHKAYQAVIDTFNDVETWDVHKISGALGILTHTAYHLSAIRQMLKMHGKMRTEK